MSIAINPPVGGGRMLSFRKEIGHFLSSAHDYYDLNFLNEEKKQTPDWKTHRNVSI